MSVEFREPPRMPQPEQWLSEHPVMQALIFVAVLAVPFVVVWLW